MSRPTGRTPTDMERRHLRLLLELRKHYRAEAREQRKALAEYVRELRDDGCEVPS